MVISLPPPPKANAEAEAKAKAEAEAKAARGTILESRLLPCHSVDFGKGGRTPAPPPRSAARRRGAGRGERPSKGPYSAALQPHRAVRTPIQGVSWSGPSEAIWGNLCCAWTFLGRPVRCDTAPPFPGTSLRKNPFPR